MEDMLGNELDKIWWILIFTLVIFVLGLIDDDKDKRKDSNH